MHFLLYLRVLKGQLQTNFKKNFNKNPAIKNKDFNQSDRMNNNTSDDISSKVSGDIKLKCEKAIQEVQYIKSFTPWPITEVKKPVANPDIIYLNNSRLRKKVHLSNNNNKGDVNQHDMSENYINELSINEINVNESSLSKNTSNTTKHNANSTIDPTEPPTLTKKHQ